MMETDLQQTRAQLAELQLSLQVRGDSLQQLKGQLLHTGLAGDSQSQWEGGIGSKQFTHSPTDLPSQVRGVFKIESTSVNSAEP